MILPKGSGNSKSPHFLPLLKAAVSSSSPLMSRGKGMPLESNVKGFISIKVKSRSRNTCQKVIGKLTAPRARPATSAREAAFDEHVAIVHTGVARQSAQELDACWRMTKHDPISNYLIACCNEVLHLFPEFNGESCCQRGQATLVDSISSEKAEMVNLIPTAVCF